MSGCPTCSGRGWVHGECNYRPGGATRCATGMVWRGLRACPESWPCPNPECPVLHPKLSATDATRNGRPADEDPNSPAYAYDDLDALQAPAFGRPTSHDDRSGGRQ